MTCPNIDRLIDSLAAGGPDPEIEAHLLVCSTCKADMETIRELSLALDPEVEIPDHLIERILDSLPFPEQEPQPHTVPIPQVVVSGVLGFVTTLAVLILTGVGGQGSPGDMVLFSVAAGGGAMAVQARVRESTPTD